jgi:hypothetical protein
MHELAEYFETHCGGTIARMFRMFPSSSSRKPIPKYATLAVVFAKLGVIWCVFVLRQ